MSISSWMPSEVETGTGQSCVQADWGGLSHRYLSGRGSEEPARPGVGGRGTAAELTAWNSGTARASSCSEPRPRVWLLCLRINQSLGERCSVGSRPSAVAWQLGS